MKFSKSRFISIFTILRMIISMFSYAPVHAVTNGSGVISGYVWYDFNGNGKWEANNWHESIISGVRVDLCDSNNVTLATTSTSDKGQYVFSGLSEKAFMDPLLLQLIMDVVSY